MTDVLPRMCAFQFFAALLFHKPFVEHSLLHEHCCFAGRLACSDDRFADWAVSVGVECGLLGADEKRDMIHELDAVVGHLYGLSEPQLIHIFETFHQGWDYEHRLTRVLGYFDAWKVLS